jgi:Bacterial lipid A biosynthesis acyltransferase
VHQTCPRVFAPVQHHSFNCCRIQSTLPPRLCRVFHDRLRRPSDSVTLYVVLVTSRLLLRCIVADCFRERETLQQRLGCIGARARGAGLSKGGFSSLSHGPSCVGKLLKNLGFALMVALLRTLSILPYTFVARLGSALGAALYSLPSRRKHVVLVNLRLCFPEKTRVNTTSLRENTFGM